MASSLVMVPARSFSVSSLLLWTSSSVSLVMMLTSYDAVFEVCQFFFEGCEN